MPKQERAEVTRNTILNAAALAFDQHGYLGTSISDILRVGGVTKGALYFHFPSKEALAQALVDMQFIVSEPLLSAEEQGVQTVIDMCHSMARALQEDVRVRAAIRLVIEQGSFTEPDSAPYQAWMEVTQNLLKHAKRRGDVKKDVDVAHFAWLIVASWTGIQLTSQVISGRADLRERTTDMWKALLPGLVPPRRIARFDPAGSPATSAVSPAVFGGNRWSPSAQQETVSSH